jgi:accessory gene regulator B
MISLESLAVSIGKKSKKALNLDDDKEEIVVYGAILFLNICISVFCVIILGFLFGVLYEALLFALIVSFLRKYSGGVHASSPGRCAILGALFSVGAGIIIDKTLFSINCNLVISISILLLIISFFIVYKNAPVDSLNKRITDIELRKRFRVNSIKIVSVALLVVIALFICFLFSSDIFYIRTIECISIAIMFQSLSLLVKK